MSINFALYQLVFKILGRQTGRISPVKYTPQKPRFENTPIQQPFPRATPESQGVSSEFLRAFLKKMREDAEANPHHVMIARHGCVICECSFAPYERGMWHATHSLCKAFIGMAVGLLIDEGKLRLDECVQDIFPEYTNPLTRAFGKKVTIRNLLDMTSGVSFAESGAVSGNNWRAGFLSSRRKAEPGESFDYNSMNSYILSAVIQKRTGMTMSAYLKQKLFDPMGITEYFWEESPEGITKGGWGMYIRPEDALKLGQLYLENGRWNGKQLIPEEWVRTSIRLQSDNGGFGYGFHIWLGERKGSFAYEGLFGQYVVVYPDLDMVVLVFAGNREMMGSGNLTKIIRSAFAEKAQESEAENALRALPVEKRFSPDGALPENPEALEKLHSLIREYETVPKSPESRGLPGHPLLKQPVSAEISEFPLPETVSAGNPDPFPEPGPVNADSFGEALAGKRWRMEKGNIGVFPLVSQVLHNNFTDGIREVGFERENGALTLLLAEGKDHHRIRLGFGQPEKSEIMLHGEPYAVGAFARISRDERNRPALIAEITFLEDTCTRILVFFFDGEELELRADEIPGSDVIREALTLTDALPGSDRFRMIGKLMKDGGTEILTAAIEAAVRPTDRGQLN